MFGFKKEIEAATPDSYYPSIYKIDYQSLKGENIDALLFDIDNTITKVDDLNIPKETTNLIENLNSVIKIDSSSLNIFSFEGLLKSLISVSFVSLLFSYSLLIFRSITPRRRH